MDDEAKKKERFDYYQSALLVDGRFPFAGILLQRAARLFANRCALDYKNEQITYYDLYQRSMVITHLLLEKGVKPGDRVCMLVENSIEFYGIYYGIWQTGAVVVPLNTFLHEKELTHIINDSQATLLITTSSFKNTISSLSLAILFYEQNHDNQKRPDETISFAIPARDPNQIAVLLYTSGTTGTPKGVMLSSKNILTNVLQCACLIDVHKDDSLLGILPFFHSFAQNTCIWSAIFVGGRIIIIPKIERKWIVQGLAKKPTIIMGVPALYGLFCLMRTVQFDRVRYFICGGDALPDKIFAGFSLLYRRKICNGFGLTETSPLIAINLDDDLAESNTVGYPAYQLECSLRDEQGKEIAKDQIGILWVKGDNIMMGYYNAPLLTQEVMKDGWFNTGDLARFDAKGRLIITGRQKDLIINKGINIYPQEIENIIMMHPAVIRVAVVGKKDLEVGEIPVAFIVLKEKIDNVQTIFTQLCSQHLAPYKIPRQFTAVESLPLTSLGKIDKKRIKKELLNQ